MILVYSEATLLETKYIACKIINKRSLNTKNREFQAPNKMHPSAMSEYAMPQGRAELSRLERSRAKERIAGLERGMCLTSRNVNWPVISRSKDHMVFNAQERSWKERSSLTRFSLQRCSGISLLRMKTPKWLNCLGSIIMVCTYFFKL